MSGEAVLQRKPVGCRWSINSKGQEEIRCLINREHQLAACIQHGCCLLIGSQSTVWPRELYNDNRLWAMCNLKPVKVIVVCQWAVKGAVLIRGFAKSHQMCPFPQKWEFQQLWSHRFAVRSKYRNVSGSTVYREMQSFGGTWCSQQRQHRITFRECPLWVVIGKEDWSCASGNFFSFFFFFFAFGFGFFKMGFPYVALSILELAL